MFGYFIAILILLFGFIANQYTRIKEYTGGRRHKKSQESKNPTELTFINASTDISDDDLKQYLPNWKQIQPDYTDKIDLVFGLGPIKQKQLNYTRATLKYRLNADPMTDKASLHEILGKFAPNTIAKTFEVTPDSTVPAGETLIVRANWGWSGSANVVARNTEQLQAAYKKFTENRPNSATPARVIASQYILNPMLFKGYKCHIRAYLIAACLQNVRYFLTIPFMEVLTAKKPYVADNFDDKEAHDSHFNEEVYGLVDDLGIPDIRKRIYDLMRAATAPFIGRMELYPESPNAYDLFGVDIMLRETGEPVLIEINKLPAIKFGKRDDYRAEFMKQIMAAFVNGPISDTFGLPADKSELIYIVPPRTFAYIGDGLPELSIQKRLIGWKQVPIETGYADLVIASGRGLDDRKLYKCSADFKCHLDMQDWTNKRALYGHLEKIAPEFIPKSFVVTETSELAPGEVYIVRAGWGFGGRAVEIATNTAELQEYRRRFAAQKSDDTIASEYIANPLLYNGRKFHLRIYALVSAEPSGDPDNSGIGGQDSFYEHSSEGRRYHFAVMPRGLVIPAISEYKMGDWNNKDIHDTHGKGNPLLGIFPSDYIRVMGNDPSAQINDCLRKSLVPILEKIKIYPESKRGYELLGIDIMFTADGEIRIIEVNNNPGVTWMAVHPAGPETAELMLDFIFAEAIGPAFGIGTESVPGTVVL